MRIAQVSADYPHRGEVFFVDLDPVIGSEQGGRRPALVVQNDIANRFSSVVIVALITSRPAKKIYPFEVRVTPVQSGLPRTSRILLNQIRTIDKRRFERRAGQLAPETMLGVDRAMRVSLGLEPI